MIILRDAGNVPGSTPALLYLAASGPPLPLRDVQTGRRSPGGTPDPTCDETKADVSGGSGGEVVTLSEFNGAPPVTAPPGAVSLAELAGASSVDPAAPRLGSPHARLADAQTRSRTRAARGDHARRAGRRSTMNAPSSVATRSGASMLSSV